MNKCCFILLILTAVAVSSAEAYGADSDVVSQTEIQPCVSSENNVKESVESGEIIEYTNKNVSIVVNKGKRIKMEHLNEKWWMSKGHWAGFGIGYNGLISNFGDWSLPEDGKYLSQETKSVTVSVNLVDFAIVSSSRWSLMSGIGFEFNNFQFEGGVTLASHNGHLVPDYSYPLNGIAVKKSKLVTAYMNIPLIVEYRFGANRRCFVNAGVIGGWRMQSHTKVKANMSGDNKTKVKNDQHIKNFHYGGTLSVGYRNVGLYAIYYPGSLFRTDQGPYVEQINIGLALYL